MFGSHGRWLWIPGTGAEKAPPGSVPRPSAAPPGVSSRVSVAPSGISLGKKEDHNGSKSTLHLVLNQEDRGGATKEAKEHPAEGAGDHKDKAGKGGGGGGKGRGGGGGGKKGHGGGHGRGKGGDKESRGTLSFLDYEMDKCELNINRREYKN